MSDQSLPQRRYGFQFVVLLVVAALLAGAVFALRSIGSSSAAPLNPDDPMSLWKSASAAQKRATAEMLLERMKGKGTIGPNTQTMLLDRAKAQRFVDDLVLQLDIATDQNRGEYVSPGSPISQTGNAAAQALGWKH